jgi:hypothetical protein
MFRITSSISIAPKFATYWIISNVTIIPRDIPNVFRNDGMVFAKRTEPKNPLGQIR